MKKCLTHKKGSDNYSILQTIHMVHPVERIDLWLQIEIRDTSLSDTNEINPVSSQCSKMVISHTFCPKGNIF